MAELQFGQQCSDAQKNLEEQEFELLSDMSTADIVVFLALLTGVSRTDHYIKLYSVFGAESVMFLNLFASNIFKVPSLKYLIKSKEYSKIYAYLSSREFTDTAYSSAAKLFSKRIPHLKAIVKKVKREMAKISEDKVVYPIKDVVKDERPIEQSQSPDISESIEPEIESTEFGAVEELGANTTEHEPILDDELTDE